MMLMMTRAWRWAMALAVGAMAAGSCAIDPLDECLEDDSCGLPAGGGTGGEAGGATAGGGTGAAGGGCASCDGACAKCVAGACVLLAEGEPGQPSCAPYLCDGETPACPASCSTEQSCVPEHFCAGDKSCKKKGEQGESCAGAGECASGFCADAVCCNNECTNTCRACNVPGKEGTCAEVAEGEPDPGTCEGPAKACDGAAYCKLVLGQGCQAGTSCLSGFCADGMCCENGCTDTCLACNLSGSEGTCGPVPKGQEDPSASSPCKLTKACDGE
ncbi:MAG: hypothetical protein HY744_34070, partial [Deltaproteobacteria bacterium]|nr:hypothetical protein [Deltaproteobacteria bacterium]